MIKVEDDYISDHHFLELKTNMRNFEFPWHRRNNSLTAEGQEDVSLFPEDQEWVAFRDNQTAEHEVFDYYFRPDLPSHQLIIPVGDKVSTEYGEEILYNRFTAHMLPAVKEGYLTSPHVDIKEPEYKWKTGILMLDDGYQINIHENEWNGEDPRPLTVKEVVDSRPNRVVIFDSSLYYTVTGPKDNTGMFVRFIFTEYDNVPDWMNGRDETGYEPEPEKEWYEED